LSDHVTSRYRAASVLVPAVLAGALLAGCSYSVRDVENPVAMPAAWDAPITPDAVAAVPQDWWKGFNSPVLNELIERALKDSPTLIAAEERLKQAERNFARSRDDLFPELSLSASTGRTRSGGNEIPESTNDSTSARLSTSYSVDIFGIQAARYRTQVATFIGTKYDTDLARITLAQNVARAYFNLLGVRSRVRVARENLVIAEELLRIFEARYRLGVATEFTFRQQTTQVQQQRTQLIPLENQMRAAETALGLLLGITPQDFHIEGEPIEQLSVPSIAPWVPSELLLRRPDMAAAELDMANASANLYIARASLIPVTLSLNASGNAGSQELFQLTDSRTFSVGGVLSIAEGIFNFRQRRTNVLNAESNEYIALVNYAQTIRQALKEVDDTLANAEANLRSEEITRETLTNAQIALDLANVEIRAGSGQLQEVLDAQRSLFSAQDSLVQSRLTRLNTAVGLFVALGGGWAPPAP
jgi:NodT family efflux transporter outer membrane factor (OMF) lipoprotein